MNELSQSDFDRDALAEPPERPLRILFLMRHFMYLRNYESTLRALAARGHTVVLGYEEAHEKVSDEITKLAESLGREIPNFEIKRMPMRGDRWFGLAHQMRSLRNYCRYMTPELEKSKKCASRAESLLMPELRWISELPEPERARTAKRYAKRLAWLEYALPLDPAITDAITAVAPDIIAITPLVDLNSTQVDYVKAARYLRIPSIHCVASWDNLTNKGTVLVAPDVMLVWNEAQRQEAISLHGMPPERIKVTGAQLFDEWFERRPSRDRAEFCKLAGLDPARPFILYTCSSVFIARYESEFFKRWLKELRNSLDPRLRSIGVLVRPHPGSTKYAEQWNQPEIADAENVSVFPRSGGYPVTEAARADYFDSLYHSAAVVGINTSAMLEAGILGKQCLTVLDPEIVESQDGMVHFAHLTSDNFLMTAGSFEEHLKQLEKVLDGGDDRAARKRFIQDFLRPHGASSPATPIVVNEIEHGAERKTTRLPVWPRMFQPALFPFALLLDWVSSRLTIKKWDKIDVGEAVAKAAENARKQVKRQVITRPANAVRRAQSRLKKQGKRTMKQARGLRAATAGRIRRIINRPARAVRRGGNQLKKQTKKTRKMAMRIGLAAAGPLLKEASQEKSLTALLTHSLPERTWRLGRRIVWRMRKLLDPSLAAISDSYANKQYYLIDRLDAARSQWKGLRRLVGGHYLLHFPGQLTPTERVAFLNLKEAEVVVPRICRHVVKDALRDESGTRTVLVGPWTTEVGFELLYWIPFVRHFTRRHDVSSNRLVAVSRGGASGWYDGVCDRYVDLFDLIDVETFIRETKKREEHQGGKKGFGLAPSAFDREMYKLAAERLGLDDYAFLSPNTMYVSFRNIWRGRYSADRLLKSIDIEPMTHRYERPDLPFSGPYSVLKFYSSANFKPGPETSEFIRLLIGRLARSGPVVLLNTGVKLDDHADVELDSSLEVFDASKLYGPRDNLAVQSALVAHAKSLHCTYGGFAYLGPLLAVPTVCYFTEPTFVGVHLDLAVRQLDPTGGLLAVSPVRVAMNEMRKAGRGSTVLAASS